jgi:hypothetical protein
MMQALRNLAVCNTLSVETLHGQDKPYLLVTFTRACPLTAFFPPNIMLPLFENEIECKKSSSNKVSVGIGVVIGENSSSVNAFEGGVFGVFGRLSFLDPGFLQRKLPDLILSLFGA